MSNYKIIITSNAEQAIQFAASEIKHFIFECTGEDLAVVNFYDGKGVYVGCGKNFIRTSDKEDEFAVIYENKNVYLLSDNPRGVLYAAYDFIEKILGVRFLTSEYTYIPKYSGLKNEPVSYNSVPAFSTRMFLTKQMQDDLFSSRLKLYSENYKIREEYGGRFNWNGKYGNNHSLLNMVPVHRYFTDDNKNDNKHMYQLNDKGEPIDICISDGITIDGKVDENMSVSAFKVTLQTLKDIIVSDLKCKYISIGQMDHTNPCMCERCLAMEKKYKRSGINVLFGNLLLENLRKWMKEIGIERDIHLIIFAYNYSEFAPVKRVNGSVVPIIKADKNLHVRIATISTNCYYSISSDMHFVPYKRIIDEWSVVCQNLMFWTYHTNYKCYPWFFPTMQHWKEDLEYFKSLNAEYVFMQSNHQEKVDWKAEMETYVASKMLWNPNSDPYEIRNEYIELYYGPVAEQVKQIINIFESNYKDIALRAEKMRREFYFDIFGEEINFPENVSTEEIYKKLRKEADFEWTKNVYFHIYHKEIMWAKEQPISLLEKQMMLLMSAKEQVANLDDSDRLIFALEKIEITLRLMILFNYKTYYGDFGEKEYKSQFFNLCDKLGFKKFGEGSKIEKIKEKLEF